MSTLREHFQPLHRPTYRYPEKWKRVARRLAETIGPRKTAYVFGVSINTLGNWLYKN